MQSPLPFRSKLPTVGPSIFGVMTAKANAHNALNLAQGFPHFPSDPLLFEIAAEAMREGRNQYAPANGIPELRQIIAEIALNHYGAKIDPESEVTVMAGASEVLYVVLDAIVDPGDEIIVFEPYYELYPPAIEVQGGVPVMIPLHAPHYAIDWARVEHSITPRTRAIILNSPHNPTGSVLTAQDLDALEQIVARHPNLLLISDEVYEHIVFDGLAHQSVLRRQALAERAFVVGSFGKSLHVTGWRIGFCIAPAELSVEIRRIHQYVSFAAPAPLQYAVARYITRRPDTLKALPAFYQQKRDFFAQKMEKSRFTPIAAHGSYFQLYSYAGISTEGDIAFADRLILEHGVATIPVSVFYRNGEDYRVLRFCFAKDEAILAAAAEKLCAV